jgi:hypothetical protein
MRTIISLLALSFAAAACGDKQPTSPNTGKSPSPGVSSPRTQLAKSPDAKPTDQVGFSKVQTVSSSLESVVAGESKDVFAYCPAGTTVVSGGHLAWVSGSAPFISMSYPDGDRWHILVVNDQAGAAFLTIRAWVVCVS